MVNPTTLLRAPLGKGTLSYVRLVPEPEGFDFSYPPDAFQVRWTDDASDRPITSLAELSRIDTARMSAGARLDGSDALSLARILAILLDLGPVVFEPALYAEAVQADVARRLFKPAFNGRTLMFVAERQVEREAELEEFVEVAFDLATLDYTASSYSIGP